MGIPPDWYDVTCWGGNHALVVACVWLEDEAYEGSSGGGVCIDASLSFKESSSLVDRKSAHIGCKRRRVEAGFAHDRQWL